MRKSPYSQEQIVMALRGRAGARGLSSFEDPAGAVNRLLTISQISVIRPT